MHMGQRPYLPLEAMRERCLNAVSLGWREVLLITGHLLGCIRRSRRIKAALRAALIFPGPLRSLVGVQQEIKKNQGRASRGLDSSWTLEKSSSGASGAQE